MANVTIGSAGPETRLAMLRVWMALSAVWVAFWLMIAALVALTTETSNLPLRLPGLVALIAVTPPIALLGVGAMSRWIFEALSRRADNN